MLQSILIGGGAMLAALVVVWALAYHEARGWMWAIALALGIAALAWAGLPVAALVALGVMAGVFALFAMVAQLRRAVISKPIFSIFKKVMPEMSETERAALEAGTTWWDADLFTGKPDWSKLLAFPQAKLTAEEQAFIDGPTEQLCKMLDDWDITHERADLPPAAWQFIRDKGFLGIIIPKAYGGLGFGNYAHSQIVCKLATRSGTAAVTVMVPNSLGPGELLMHYGTEEQKNRLLPRLAAGQEIPCFGLTNPDAGSDAASIPDFGIVCKGEHEGKETLGIRLTFEKRYITLAPVATIVGLAFRLHDPDKLLGGKDDVGITLALVPSTHKGMQIGRRHFPLNSAFMNGPIFGKDVFIPMEWVIGGAKMAGQGWRMLMECLAAGRAISLPGMSMAAGWASTRATGAYARVRSQFKTPIGKFEGIEEALARIGATTYLMDATRKTTMAALDAGSKPSVISAINKYHMTERMRGIINDAMDVHGGKGICLGPNNYLGRAYQSVPIAITVEGANILTRSLIIFGQGAIRCHPYVLPEMNAARNNSLADFDQVFWSHIAFTVGNAARSLWLGITGGKTVSVPGSAETRRYFQMMTRFSSAFGLLADVSMFVIGGSLKRKEKLSARLGDVLSLLYLASCTLKRYHDDGCKQEDLPLMKWALYDSLFKAQVAMDGIIDNFPNPIIGRLLRVLVFPKGITLEQPSDHLGHEVSKLLIEPSATRDRLTAGMYLPRDENDVLGRLEFAMEATIACEPIESRIRKAQKEGTVGRHRSLAEVFAAAVKAGIINETEHAQLVRKEKLRRACIDVDDFEFDLSHKSAKNKEEQAWPLKAAASM